MSILCVIEYLVLKQFNHICKCFYLDLVYDMIASGYYLLLFI